MKQETKETIMLLETAYALKIDRYIRDIKDLEPEHYNEVFDRFVTRYVKELDGMNYENKHTENVIYAINKMNDPFDAGLSILRNHLLLDDPCLDNFMMEYWRKLLRATESDPDFY